MENQMVLYGVLSFAFICGGIYNFTIYKQCIYPVKLRKSRIGLLVIVSLVFVIIAYVGGNAWYNYILAILGSIIIISSVIGEGIHEKGIYYHYGRGVLARLAKWEDIKDITIDTNKNKLQSFKLKTKTIFLDQYYRPEDIHEILKYIEHM